MSPPSLASLLLPVDAFDTSTHQVMGRRVAGSSFAQGMAASLERGDKLSLFTGSRAALPALRTLLQPMLKPGAKVELHADLDPALIARSGCLHLPDPALHHWCWLRADSVASSFSLTGVTHTLCSHGVIQGLEQLVTAPLEPWDALVCTSRSALLVVQKAMACMHERLERRFQQTLIPPQGPQLPLIPLGIDPEPFDWRDALVYMVMTDRFRDGDQANNPLPISQSDPRGDFQGGDLEGLRQAIADGSLDKLGVRAIWLTPFQTNPGGAYFAADNYHMVTGYHGYWPTKAREVDERLGGQSLPGGAAAFL